MNINKFRVREYFQTAELARTASELRPLVMMYALDTKEIYVNGKSLGGSVSEEDLLLKQDKIDIVAASGTTLLADVNKYYRFDSPVSTLAVTLPTPDDTSHIQCLTLFFTTDTNPNVTLSGSGNNVDYFDGYSIDASTSYELNVMWNGLKWIVAYGIVG